MRQFFAAVAVLGLMALAGCGQNFEWFPDSGGGGGGTTPNPPPPGGSKIDVQADTEITFDPYVVRFGTISSSTTSASISVSSAGGNTTSKYSIDDGTPTNAAGTVKKGQTVKVIHTSSHYTNSQVSTLLIVGGASATYASTTSVLSFPNLPTAVGNPAISNQATVPAKLNGIDVGTMATISYTPTSSVMYINGSIAAPGHSIKAGDTLKFQHNHNPASGSTSYTTSGVLTLTTGTYKVTFTSTTQ